MHPVHEEVLGRNRRAEVRGRGKPGVNQRFFFFFFFFFF
jgi:hypothetical protein